MAMTPPSSTGAPDARKPHPPRRPFKKILLILSLLILVVVTLLFIWAARRYQQAVELAKRTREQYATLNTRYPFTPPQAGQELPLPRWQAMLRVREQLQNQVTPQLRLRLGALLGAGSLQDPALYHELIQGLPLFRSLLDSQLNALRREQMSAREYQWMLGLGIVRVMKSGKRGSEGEGAWRVLEQLERITHADVDRGNNIQVGAALEFLQKKYHGAGDPPPEALEALNSRDEVASAIDLLLTMAQWATPDGQKPEGLLRNLLPRHGES